MTLCSICRKDISRDDPENGETREHVIPFSWYPDSTPGHVQRWTVPSHKRCNNSFALDEQYVFEKLATTIDPRAEGARGIWDRVYRGLNPAAGKSEKSTKARARARERLLNSIVPTSDITTEMLRHGYKAISNTNPASQLLTIKAERLERVIKKILDCAHYKITGAPPMGDYEFAFNVVGLEQFSSAWEERGQYLNWEGLGPGVAVGNNFSSDADGRGALIQIFLWESLMFEGIYVWRAS